MNKLILTSLIFLLTACGRATGSQPVKTSLDRLYERQALYLDLVQEQQDSDGFILSTGKHCDSVLWSGLLGTATASVDLLAAREGLKWYRRPAKDCFAKGYTGAEISRDMYLGIFTWLLMHPDRELAVDIAEDIWYYGSNSDWIMGEGDSDIPLKNSRRTYFNGNMRATLAQLLHHLSDGRVNYKARNGAIFFAPGVTGYERHLQMLHLLIRYETYGRLSAYSKSLIRKNIEDEPLNPFYMYVSLRTEKLPLGDVVTSLLEMYPADRLPTSADWCAEVPLQRDRVHEDRNPKDWAPCRVSNPRTHPGVGLIFVTELIKQAIGS